MAIASIHSSLTVMVVAKVVVMVMSTVTMVVAKVVVIEVVTVMAVLVSRLVCERSADCSARRRHRHTAPLPPQATGKGEGRHLRGDDGGVGVETGVRVMGRLLRSLPSSTHCSAASTGHATRWRHTT